MLVFTGGACSGDYGTPCFLLALPGSKVTSSIIELPNATWKQTKPPTPFSVPRKPKIPRKNRPMKPRVVGLETCPCSRDKMQTIVDQSQADRSSTSVLKGGDDDKRFGKTPQPYQIKHKAGSQPKIRSKPKISGGKEHTPPEQETPPPSKTPETAAAVALTGYEFNYEIHLQEPSKL